MQGDLTGSVIALLVTLGLLGPVAVILRLLARHKARAQLWWDDWLIIFACAVLISLTVSDGVAVWFGVGKRVEVVAAYQDGESRIASVWKNYSTHITYALVVGPVKCSILMLYIRLFGPNKKFFIWCCFQLVLSIIWFAVTLFMSIFRCRPISRAWDPSGNRTGCLDLKALSIGVNIPNIIMDLMILLTPLWVIFHLKLPMAKKIFISSMLMLGAGEVAFSIVRLVMLMNGFSQRDITYGTARAIIWTFTEMAVGVVCACLPTLGPLLPRKAFGLSSYGSTHPRTGTASGTEFARFDRLDDESASGSTPHFNGGVNKAFDIGVGSRYTS